MCESNAREIVAQKSHYLAGPCSNGSISPALEEIPFPEAYSLDEGGRRSHFTGSNAGTAVPMVPIGHVIYFHCVLSSGRCNPFRVKHHACDRMVVSIRVVDGACSEIPYLDIALENGLK